MAKRSSTTSAQHKPSKLIGLRKEWLLLIIALLGTGYVLILYGDLFTRLQAYWSPKSELYGVWIEQNVASYSAQNLTIGPEGISMAGRLVTTHFKYDGDSLQFTVNGQQFYYQMTNASHDEMKLISASNYNPVYQLSGKYKNNLR